jgi:hypothetical protein
MQQKTSTQTEKKQQIRTLQQTQSCPTPKEPQFFAYFPYFEEKNTGL